ncbi:MGDG synthase family glycosyltransferase [Streptomyces sp. NBC_01431]|uniref:MGDG synthase family glycosyltransferase n=1 Tax=Streptomyces sp. NBC_01431 TaxID=2903863 RepID=UPI002E30C102|nr:UDP-N-acetylglucosamine--N-acetylglucosamine transferase [Streptomyces sp. NBC_01431]
MPRRDIPNDVRPTGPARTGRITIVSASVGAGHDGAADALGTQLEAAGFLVDRHDFLDLLPARLGRVLSGTYHRLLTTAPSGYQRIYAATERSGSPGPVIRALFRGAERRMLRAIGPRSQAVVSTYPGASQVLGALRRSGRLNIPALTYLTDFSVHPLWVAPGIDAHLAAHRVPAAQAEALGAARVLVTGPVTGARFATVTEPQRRAARDEFGLPHDAPLALLVAGSWGVGPVRESAAEIRDSGAAEPVVVCGRNTALAEQLRADGFRYVHEWVRDMPLLMRACDVLVQNAGGLTSLEAFASGLPVASYRCIPGHGQTNAAALDEAGLAAWIREPQGLTSVLSGLIEGPLGERQRAAGLALFSSGASPVVAITAVTAPAGVPVPTRRPQLAHPRLKLAAVVLAATVSLGIAAPLAHAYGSDPGRLSTVAHRFIERYEL